jgi:hypothetical protein
MAITGVASAGNGDLTVNGQVGVGTLTPASSAAIDVSSTTRGLLPPRMTAAQRDAIANPAQGLLIFNTTEGTFNYFTGSAWMALAPTNPGGGGGSGPTTTTRPPVADSSVSGTWSGSAGTRYTLVDDFPDTAPNDVLTAASNGAYHLFLFNAFDVPAGSTDISVQVMYHVRNDASEDSTIRARLYVDGNTYNYSGINIVSGTNPQQFTDTWSTNPKTGVAWTVGDVNGTSSEPLTRFGLTCPDAAPDVDVTGIQLQVTYTPPQ